MGGHDPPGPGLGRLLIIFLISLINFFFFIFIIGLSPVLLNTPHVSVEEDAQLSFHLFGGLPLGLLAAGLQSRAILISPSASALSTCSFQYCRRSFVLLAMSWISHYSLISLLLILSQRARSSIDLSVFISVDLRSCSILVVSARV